MVGAFPVFLETYHSPMSDEGNASSAYGRLNWCRRSRGRPPSSAQKAETLSSTAARISTKRLWRVAVSVMSDRGCGRQCLRTQRCRIAFQYGNVCEEPEGPVPEDLGQFRKPEDRLPMSQLVASASV